MLIRGQSVLEGGWTGVLEVLVAESRELGTSLRPGMLYACAKMATLLGDHRVWDSVRLVPYRSHFTREKI